MVTLKLYLTDGLPIADPPPILLGVVVMMAQGTCTCGNSVMCLIFIVAEEVVMVGVVEEQSLLMVMVTMSRITLVIRLVARGLGV